jgi:hypothetical protein
MVIYYGCLLEPNEPRELVVQYINLDNHLMLLYIQSYIILLINVGFKFIFYQVLGNLVSCSFPPNEATISHAYSCEHNEPNELIVIHQFNLDNHSCFCIDVLLLTNVGLRVLFYQGPRNLASYSPFHLIVDLNLVNPWSW